MSAIAAAAIGALISVIGGAIVQSENRKSDMAFQSEDKIREYNEVVRQQEASAELYRRNVSAMYGESFYSTLIGGASVTDLISQIGSGTALGQSRALYAQQARTSLVSAKRQSEQIGQLARMTSQGYLTSLLAESIQGEQVVGEAVATQSTSGIRADRGTGGNLKEIQEQQVALAQRLAREKIQAENIQTIMSVEEKQQAGSQEAEVFRQKSKIETQEAIERAEIEYAKFLYEMKDYDESQKNIMAEVNAYKKEAGNKAKKITETYDADLIDASQFKFIDD